MQHNIELGAGFRTAAAATPDSAWSSGRDGARTVRFGGGIGQQEARLVLAELAVGAGIERPAA